MPVSETPSAQSRPGAIRYDYLELLRHRIIELVRDFAAHPPGLTQQDLDLLFGPGGNSVAAALARLPISFSLPE